MADNQHWVGSWTMAPAPAETGAFTNQTLRMTMRASLGGNQVRVRISNAYGRRPLDIGGAHIALRDKGAAIVAVFSPPKLSLRSEPAMIAGPASRKAMQALPISRGRCP